jgi:hypothetical protein
MPPQSSGLKQVGQGIGCFIQPGYRERGHSDLWDGQEYGPQPEPIGTEGRKTAIYFCYLFLTPHTSDVKMKTACFSQTSVTT